MINYREEFTNINGFKEMYKDLYSEYINLNEDDDLRNTVKEYINLVYGICTNQDPNAYIKASVNMSFVITRLRMIVTSLKREFIGHVAYIDTDTLFFHHYDEVKNRVDESLDRLMNKYDYLSVYIEEYKTGIFIGLKKVFLIDKNDKQIIKGLRRI